MELVKEYWANLPSTAKAALLGVGGLSFLVLLWRRKRRMGNRTAALHNADFEHDRVYLYQFPSCRTIVTVSPFALKLETWLRWQKIPYETTRGTQLWSKHGQIPFVELNGEQIADSNIIIQKLTKHFNKADDLSPEKQSVARAFEMMLENQTVFSYFYYRYVNDAPNFIGTWEFLPKIPRFMAGKFFPKSFRDRMNNHGIGKHAEEDIFDFGMQDLKAISEYLGDRPFFFGDKMTKTDCYLFGHLCQILFIPVEYPHKEYIRKNCPNLVEYTNRLKAEFWPDWDQVCEENLQLK